MLLIKEYPEYSVDLNGNVYSNRSGKLKKLTPSKQSSGYITVTISGKTKYVHRLVAQTFIPNPENKPEVNHLDGDKSNNAVSNLEWVTPSENVRHAVDTGLNQMRKPVNQYTLDGVFVKTHESASAAAEAMGHPNGAGNIVNCCNMRARSVWGYMWFYKENDIGTHKYVDYDEERQRPVNQYTKSGEFVKTYPSATHAARDMKGSQANIWACCEHKPHHNSVYGYKWEYANIKDVLGGKEMLENNNNVEDVELAPLATNFMMLFGVNVNLQRSIPMVLDGLKPVVRRIMYLMYKNHKLNKVKVNEVIGELAKIHPHGDQGMGGVFARLAQTFSNNIPLLSTAETGNSGNATSGNDYASPRYLDMKMSKFAMEVLFDEFDGKVNMKPSYDGSTVEPFVLPAKFPIILLNGTSGIGYTLSSDIHPYNLCEIADATVKLLKNPNANVRLIPDLPTGCDIIVKDEFTFVMQSSFDIDSVNYIITIKNTPYLKYLDDIDKALRAIQDSDNPIKEILSADDESELIEGDIKYVIRCKPCNLYDVVNKLFKRVPGFRATISTRNMIVVDSEFRTKEYTVRQILCSWIKSRFIEKRAWFLRKLVAKTTEHNMLEGKAYMLSPKNLDKTIKVFRSCNSRDEIVPSLVKAYEGNITTSQANYISELKLYRLTNNEYKETLEKMDEIQKEIDDIRGIVEDPEKIRDVIIDEIKTIKSKYGNPRRSKILNIGERETVNIGVVQILTDGSVLFGETENPEHLSSDVTPVSGDDVCLIDDRGYFVWVNTQKVGHNRPMTLTSVGKTQMGKCVSAVSNRNNDILILTNKGRIKYMPIGKIPSNATRKPLIPLYDDEFIVTVLELRDMSSDILVYTNDGYGKRIQLTDLNKVLSVDAAGQFIMKEYDVSGMFCINSNKPLLVYVTKLGRMRANASKFLTSVKKFAEPKPIIKLSAQDDLIAVFCANPDQTITLNHADGRVTTVNVESLGVSTMAIEPARPKHVPAVKVLRATIS